MRLLLATILLLLAHPPSIRADEGLTGFVVTALQDASTPLAEVGLWYPAEAATAQAVQVGPFVQTIAPAASLRGRGLPVVVMSHGSGGSFTSHADTALALAQAGFVVAAFTHAGDNYRDGSRATDLDLRTRQFAAVVEHVLVALGADAVDPGRIGAFGFSAGGFTVLAAAGGTPDLGRIEAHCAANPGFFDCRLMAGGSGAAHLTRPARAPRPVRALVVAAPALGFTFGAGSLDALTMPVQLWQANDDQILRAPFYVEPVRAALPRPAEIHRVAKAGHFDFLAPCSDVLARAAPTICASAPGFDRSAFHVDFNAEVVRFMTEALRP